MSRRKRCSQWLRNRCQYAEVFQIGADPPFGNNFDGTIDELTIYNRALTLAEVQSIFNAGTIGKCR
jgi:hypothetical protein